MRVLPCQFKSRCSYYCFPVRLMNARPIGCQNKLMWTPVPQVTGIKLGVLDVWTSSFKGDTHDLVWYRSCREKAGQCLLAPSGFREDMSAPECKLRASLVAEWWGVCLLMKETWVLSLGWGDPLEKEMATHSSTLAWEMPWTEEPGGLQSTGSRSQAWLTD